MRRDRRRRRSRMTVSVVYLVGTPACEAGGTGSNPVGCPFEYRSVLLGEQAASKTAVKRPPPTQAALVCPVGARNPCTPADADVARLRKAPVLPASLETLADDAGANPVVGSLSRWCNGTPTTAARRRPTLLTRIIHPRPEFGQADVA